MKITRNTPDQLIVADVPWIIGLALIAFILVFIGAGLAMLASGELWGLLFAVFGGGIGALCFVLFVRRTQAIFHRTRGLFTLRSRTVFRYTEQGWPLAQVERAIVETSYDSDGNTHRPTILMREGAERRIALTPVYTSGGGAERMRDAINDWLGALDSETGTP